ncbi:MAG: ferrochelatase [Microthrixaceae bacterium]
MTLNSPTPKERIGVLVMAYGTPSSPEAIPEYYTHIRRGRPPTEEQLQDLISRYAAIGGISPLRERTQAQLDAVESALQALATQAGHEDCFVVQLGQKHSAPFVEDGVAALAQAGVSRIVGLVLAPHYSGFSVGQYHQRAATSAEELGLSFVGLDSWSLEDAYLTHQANSVREQLAGLPEQTQVFFTAHSLPERVLVEDPYPDQLSASAQAISERAGLNDQQYSGNPPWSISWQSAGRTPEPWRGPDILESMAEVAETASAQGVLVVPQGFTADHLEVLFDLDIEAANLAQELGLAFARTEVVNADPQVMAALAARLFELAEL